MDWMKAAVTVVFALAACVVILVVILLPPRPVNPGKLIKVSIDNTLLCDEAAQHREIFATATKTKSMWFAHKAMFAYMATRNELGDFICYLYRQPVTWSLTGKYEQVYGVYQPDGSYATMYIAEVRYPDVDGKPLVGWIGLEEQMARRTLPLGKDA